MSRSDTDPGGDIRVGWPAKPPRWAGQRDTARVMHGEALGVVRVRDGGGGRGLDGGEGGRDNGSSMPRVGGRKEKGGRAGPGLGGIRGLNYGRRRRSRAALLRG